MHICRSPHYQGGFEGPTCVLWLSVMRVLWLSVMRVLWLSVMRVLWLFPDACALAIPDPNINSKLRHGPVLSLQLIITAP